MLWVVKLTGEQGLLSSLSSVSADGIEGDEEEDEEEEGKNRNAVREKSSSSHIVTVTS